MNTLRIVIGCFCGGFIGTILSRQYLPTGWLWLGMLVGGCVGYVSSAPRSFIAGCWRAFRESTERYFARDWALRRRWFRMQLKESFIASYLTAIILTEVLCLIIALFGLAGPPPTEGRIFFTLQFLGFMYPVLSIGLMGAFVVLASLRFLTSSADGDFTHPIPQGGGYNKNWNQPPEWLQWSAMTKIYPTITFVVIIKRLWLIASYLFLGVAVKKSGDILSGIGRFIALAIRYTATHTRFICLIGGAVGTWGGVLVQSPIVGGLIGAGSGLMLSYVARWATAHMPQLQRARV